VIWGDINKGLHLLKTVFAVTVLVCVVYSTGSGQ